MDLTWKVLGHLDYIPGNSEDTEIGSILEHKVGTLKYITSATSYRVIGFARINNKMFLSVV